MRKLPKFIYDEEKALEVSTRTAIAHLSGNQLTSMGIIFQILINIIIDMFAKSV